jgi:O-methyltransferase
MDNVFITQHFDWNTPGSWKLRAANRLLARLGYRSRLVGPCQTGSMTNVEQRMNVFHLVMGVLTGGVAGDLVEFGTFRGTTAALMQMVVHQFDPGRRLHVYDTFSEAPASELTATFKGLNLPVPAIHAGDLRAIPPGELPERIAFAHVDVGPGDSPDGYERTLRHCLESLYPRLSPGGVCLLADYCQPDVYDRPGHHRPHAELSQAMWHLYPVVKRTADAFLSDKPERVYYLYAGAFSHGFFRKQ